MITAQTHPDDGQLNDYGLGRLDDAVSALVERHLADCEPCRRVVMAVPGDPLMQLLQAAYAQPGPEDLYPRPAVEPPSSAEEALPPLYRKVAAILGSPTVSAASLTEKTAVHVPNGLADHSRYRVLKELGSGGMGTVYKARHLLMDRLVALKVMNPEFLSKVRAVERFTQEVKAAAQLSHPNIVTAHDAETVGDLHFLVMEYVEGKTLARIVDEAGFLPRDRACEYARQAALGLQHAHERGMVHRDIKPQNLMLTESPGSQPREVVKILDFGLARFRSESRREGSGTEFGTLMGSPDYIAPEQARDARQADIRADIYGLGCTLYFLLTGRVPFPAGSTAEKVAAHLEHMATPVTRLRPDVPAGLARVLERMMAKRPADRFRTPAEVAAALAPFCIAEVPPRPTPRKTVFQRRVFWPAAALLLFGLTVAGVEFGPTVFRFTPNREVSVPETNKPDAEVSVKKAVEPVRVADGKGSPEVVKKEETRKDESRETKLPASPGRLTSSRSFEVGKTPLAYSLSLLHYRLVHLELGLSEEQKARIPPLPAGVSSLTSTIDEQTLNALLRPEQAKRLRELQLQQLQGRSSLVGPTNLFRYHEVVEGLGLSEEQWQRLQQLVNNDAKQYAEISKSNLSAADRLAQRQQHNEQIEKDLASLLTDAQKSKRAELLGKPFPFPLSSVRSFEVGKALFIYPYAYLDDPSVQQELGLTQEQKTRIASLKKAPGEASNLDGQTVNQLLRPDQVQRLREIRLQQLQRVQTAPPGLVSRGPTYVFRYREIVEGLDLSEEQRQRLQQLVDEDARTYPGIPANDRTKHDEQIEKQLAALLTDAQKTRRAELPGKEFTIAPVVRSGPPRSKRTKTQTLLAEARKLLNEQKYPEALAAGTEALRLDPNLAEAHRVRGEAYQRREEYAKAAAEFTQEINHDSKDLVGAYMWRARAYQCLRAFEPCIQDSTTVLELLAKANDSPANRGRSLVERGWALSNLGKYEQGLADLEEAVKLNPDHAPALLLRSFVLARMGEQDRAKADRERALQLNPKIMETHGHNETTLIIPVPLHFWILQGRHVLQVSQDGKAPYRSISDALKVVKPGDVIEVLDRGPYRESVFMTNPVENIGLISRVGTRIEIPAWRKWGPSPWNKDKTIYQGALFLCPNGLRLSGLEFVCPPPPPDTEQAISVEVAAAGEVAIESCRVYQTPRFERPAPVPGGSIFGMLVGWHGPGSVGRARYLIQETLLDGLLFFKQDIPSRTVVQYNLIRAEQSVGLWLPLRAGETIVRHNVIQAHSGIVIRARERPQDATSAAAGHLIANNVIDTSGGVPLWAERPSADPKQLLPLWKNVRIQNNVFRSQTGTGIELHADDQKAVAGAWRLGHNCFSVEPRSVPDHFPALPRQATDVVLAGQFVSVDRQDPQYLRMAADSPLRTAGAGGDLPAYVGALPPGPAPNGGDWFTRLCRP